MVYTPGSGNPEGKIVFVGDFPGASEENSRESLIGASGEVLDNIFTYLLELPDYRSKFWFTNVVKYRPLHNKIRKPTDIEIENLWKEIDSIGPNVIVPLGELALNVITGHKKILQYRGSILPNQRYGYLPKVVPTIHPLHLTRPSYASGDYYEDKKLYNGIWRHLMAFDIQKALDESNSQELRLPDRNLRVATNSLDVYRFFEQNKKRDRFFADVETFRSTLCSCIGIAFDEYEAISIPLFQKVGDIQLCTIPHSDLARIWQLIQELFNRMRHAGQNFKFDRGKLELLGFLMGKGLISDIMLKAHTVNSELPSKGLAMLASIWTREPYYKDEGKEFNPKYHDIKRLFLYNAKDAAITAEIDLKLETELQEMSELYKTDLVKFYYEYVVPQHDLYCHIEKVGFDIDEGKLNFLRVKYETWLEILQNRLDVAAQKKININSPKQVAQFVYGDLRIPVLDRYKELKVDEDTFSRLLKNNVRNEFKRQVLVDILEFRRVSKTLSTYLLCNKDYDGRIRSQYRIIGTETGRSSTSILDEPVRPDKSGFAFQTLTKHGDIGADIRSYLVPRPGYVFINTDLGQAEARVVATLCKDDELLAAFDTIDIHRRTAWLALVTGTLDLTPGPHESDSIGKDSAERFIGKKTRHAGNYNMKWREFMSNVISDCRRFGIDFTISKFLAEKILGRFHAASPKIREVFHKEIMEAIDSTRALVTPYGRVRRFFDRYSERLYQEAFAFIPQDTVKQRITRAVYRVRKEAPQVLIGGESHDAFLFQMPIGEYEDICREVVKPAFVQPIDFSNCTLKRGTLVIPCDFEIGENYKDFKKLKLT